MRDHPLLLLLALTSLQTACLSPTLHVRHRDATLGALQLKVDGAPHGTLAPGENHDVTLERGAHTVELLAAHTATQGNVTTHADTETHMCFAVFLDGDAELLVSPQAMTNSYAEHSFPPGATSGNSFPPGATSGNSADGCHE